MSLKKPITKKVINTPETCVDDNLRGVVATFPSLQLHPKHRVITVRQTFDSKRVAILGGGGSGHEPFASGFVGAGALDGAVAGGVFASPPTGHVLYAIAQLYKYNSGGVLVIIGNYTGDRLNFGKAIEKAKILGIKVEGVIVGEDVASSKNKTGGRSMVGEVLYYKICGALASKGQDLITIRDTAVELNKYMATLGVCLSACSLPEKKQILVERIFSGHLKTSLEMHGFQICLLHLPERVGSYWLELLDAPSECSSWTGGELSCKREGAHVDDDSLLQGRVRKTASGPSLSPKEQDLLRGSLSAAAEELIKSEELLNRLDSGCGDGDCGITLKKFGCAIQSYLKTASVEYPSSVLWDLSEIAEKDMGGTSGGIYSLGLSAASLAMANAKSNEPKFWLVAWEDAMDAISKYGGAEPGDRTMLDTLHTAVEAFRQNISNDLKELLKATAAAAETGANATANMVARAGRAAYVSAAHARAEDAGARAAALWLCAALRHLTLQI